MAADDKKFDSEGHNDQIEVSLPEAAWVNTQEPGVSVHGHQGDRSPRKLKKKLYESNEKIINLKKN